MKNILLSTALLLVIISTGNGQDFNRIANLDIKTADEAKAAEGDALAAANYLLSTPMATTPERKASVRLVVMWMTATTYSFQIDDTAMNLSKKDEDMLGLVMAAMTKTALENPDVAKQPAELKLRSYKTLLDYCGEPSNNVNQSKEVKKAVEANKSGKLKEYLKL